MEPFRTADQAEKLHHIIVIVQGLSGAHQHDVGNFQPAVLLGKQHLVQYLRGSQIPGLPFFKGSTEGAAHMTPGLSGKTDAVAMLITHDHRFHTVAVCKTK